MPKKSQDNFLTLYALKKWDIESDVNDLTHITGNPFPHWNDPQPYEFKIDFRVDANNDAKINRFEYNLIFVCVNIESCRLSSSLFVETPDYT